MFFTFPSRHWKELFSQDDLKLKLETLSIWVSEEYQLHLCTPKANQIFTSFELCPEEKVKVVIIGQDPYPAEGVADGMAFSTQRPSFIPASLKNILIESGNSQIKQGDLKAWAEQGVLLLNTVLTTKVNQANAHQNKGWEQFTKAVIYYLLQKEKPIVFMLWGNQAKKQIKDLQLSAPNTLVLESGHPSPLSANRGHWFGNNHFALANDFLRKNNLELIDWKLSSDSFNREPTLF